MYHNHMQDNGTDIKGNILTIPFVYRSNAVDTMNRKPFAADIEKHLLIGNLYVCIASKCRNCYC